MSGPAPNIGENLRILSVVTRFGAGGPPINVLNLSRGLGKYGYETVIAAGSCSEQDEDMSYLITGKDKVAWIPAMSRAISPAHDLVALIQLIRLIRQYRPAIVHTHTAKAGILGRLAGWLTGTPLIVHTFHGNVLRGYFNALASWSFQKLEQLFGSISDLICVVSGQQRREITEDFQIGSDAKVRVLPLGLPLESFVALAPPPVDRQELVVAWFGRFVPIKNLPLLDAVVRQALAVLPNVHFLIAGDGPDRPIVKALTEAFPASVEYLGWQRDIVPTVSRADLIMQTSFNEGTPTALIQGMAAARPFISTAVGGLPDMVLGPPRPVGGANWHTNGVLTPLAPEPFVNALQAFAKDRTLLAGMGLIGRQWSTAHYAESQMLAAADKLYRECLAAKGHPLPPPVADELCMSGQLASLGEKLGPLVNNEREKPRK